MAVFARCRRMGTAEELWVLFPCLLASGGQEEAAGVSLQ